MLHISKLKPYVPNQEAAIDTSVSTSVPADQALIADESDLYYVREILDHTIGTFPHRYKHGPVLIFQVRWELPDNDPEAVSWNPTMIHRRLAKLNELEERRKKKERLANSGRVCTLVRLNFLRLFHNRESDLQTVATPTPVQL